MNTSCIILAAGMATRFGSLKQNLPIHGKQAWEWVYGACMEADINGKNIHVVGKDVKGGAFRQESVFNALKYVKQRRVIILEAARPAVTSEQIKELISCNHSSCTFVFPSSDTVLVKPDVYLHRAKCFRIQTPQAFNVKVLRKALKDGPLDLTDETRLLHHKLEIKPHLHFGGLNLHKLTYKEDKTILETLWNKKKF